MSGIDNEIALLVDATRAAVVERRRRGIARLHQASFARCCVVVVTQRCHIGWSLCNVLQVFNVSIV
jgi:hypothetical protein